MDTTKCNQNRKLIEKFTPLQKFFMRLGLGGALIVGAYAIYIQNILWGILYTCFIFLGMFSFLSFFCSHCPYPYENSECLFLPYTVVYTLYKFRPGPLNRMEKGVIFFITGGLILIPQYWLCKNYILFIIFWIFCALLLIPAPFYFCKRCKHAHCPLNRAKKE